MQKLIQSIGDKKWRNIISAIVTTNMEKNLDPIINSKDILPEKENIFRAFDFCPYDNLKVVILGQDPYHTPGAANGLAFSVPTGYPKTPPSLHNIKKEIAKDIYGIDDVEAMNNDLSYLAAQGVLLLNTSLTTTPGVAGAHIKLWEPFTSSLMAYLGKITTGVVYMLWGQHAESYAFFINPKNNLVLRAPHPSPFSAHKGFLGCKHFSKANEYLKQEIVW